MSRIVIEASEGMVLTNGEIFGTKIYLAEGLSGEDFHEITREEYETLQMSEEAEIEDYQEALDKLGVR